MDRLTKRDKDGKSKLSDVILLCSNLPLEKLAAYEDTGATPEQVAEWAAAHKAAKWEVGKFHSVTGEYYERCSACNEWSREYGCPYCPNCGAKMTAEAAKGE